jgi:PAS domain S-box-containing protein
MSQSSPFFNRWLSQMGPDQVIAILTDLVDAGAVFAVDASGKVLFWSKGAEKLFGLPAESVLGKPCAETLGCEEGQDPCGLAELGSIKAQIVNPKRANGERVTCYRTARAFFDAEGQFAGALEFLQPQVSTETGISKQSNNETFHGILSRDPAMLEAIKIIRNVAETEATVLIRGESGTGKELVARALHQESPRHHQPFLAINCAALTPSLLEPDYP